MLLYIVPLTVTKCFHCIAGLGEATFTDLRFSSLLTSVDTVTAKPPQYHSESSDLSEYSNILSVLLESDNSLTSDDGVLVPTLPTGMLLLMPW